MIEPTMSGPPGFVFDATCLSYFARTERLDDLGDLVLGRPCFTTHVVRDELRDGTANYPRLRDAVELEWLGVIQLDTLDALTCFVKWAKLLGAGPRHMGESSVFAAAEIHGAIAITDDRDAVRVGRKHGLDVHGTVWILALACRAGKLTETGAGNLIDTLRSEGMRVPCTGAEFGSYARCHGLL